MRRVYEQNIATSSWHWDIPDGLEILNDDIKTACLADIAKTLRRIEAAINSLGNDGIHQLIKLALKQASRRERRQALSKKRTRLRVA